MKVNLIASIPNLSATSWYSLLLLTTTPLLISFSTSISTAAPVKIAQVNTEVKINRPSLNMGSQGERVVELQAALKLLGFYSGAVDGTYQQDTAIAVSQFQQAAGLSPKGMVDNITWQTLFPTPSTINSLPGNSVSSFTTSSTKPTKNSRVNNSPAKPKNQPNIGIKPTPVNQQIPSIQYTTEGWPILRLGMSGAEVIKLQKQLQNLGFLTGKIDGDFGISTEAAVKAAQFRYGLEPDGIVGATTWKAFIKRTSTQR
jgi:peptidoglycan hydrolase-like protein with peptidoglycan-binding domain